MCCRMSCKPLHKETAVLILTTGLFVPTYWAPNRPELAWQWERKIVEDDTDPSGAPLITTVGVTLTDDEFALNLSPAISIYAHHAGRRRGASVYFEIAAKYAEKVDGEIIQRATVVGCKNEHDLVVGRYPSMPLSFLRVCNGFREILLAPLGEG